ncbi:MAG: hypothetical protein K5790_10570 [Nitrosopumilus sp.]|uniref:hypothetical protein n=1 Tax=Nitrosopumilus sp. TaxID=2024843 RepID=UPI00247DF1FF|nr:hypothetical protein [Nitrosopumilus sp.]MCV0393714.1 hypothetical protein [Nitrosopumilus sp.]
MKKPSELFWARVMFGFGLFYTSLFVVLVFVKPPKDLFLLILFPIGFGISVLMLVKGYKLAKKEKAKLK